MKYSIRSYIGTRKIQEDCAGSYVTDAGIFIVVCDGIGSRSGGGLSSQLAVQMFVDEFKNNFSVSFPQFITKVTESIDNEVYKKFGEKSGTTVVAVYLKDNELYWMSVGDSRLYIIRDGRIKQITTDHSYKYVLDVRKEKNIIDEETYIKESVKAERLASYIGMGGIDIIDISMKPLELKEEDRLLLTTDGLYKSLQEKHICDIICNGDDAEFTADKLMEAVMNFDGSIDNTTFALVFCSQI